MTLASASVMASTQVETFCDAHLLVIRIDEYFGAAARYLVGKR